MSPMASQITNLTIVYSTFYSAADQRKQQSSVSLAFVRGIHRWPVNSAHKGLVTRQMCPFDDVIMFFTFVYQNSGLYTLMTFPKISCTDTTHCLWSSTLSGNNSLILVSAEARVFIIGVIADQTSVACTWVCTRVCITYCIEHWDSCCFYEKLCALRPAQNGQQVTVGI